jgi:hypothetical protein
MSYGVPYGDESRAIYTGSFSVQDEVEVSSAVVRFSVDVHARKEWTRRRDVTPTQEE